MKPKKVLVVRIRYPEKCEDASTRTGTASKQVPTVGNIRGITNSQQTHQLEMAYRPSTAYIIPPGNFDVVPVVPFELFNLLALEMIVLFFEECAAAKCSTV